MDKDGCKGSRSSLSLPSLETRAETFLTMGNVRAFELICHYSELGQSPSLWSMWHWINSFAAQLRELDGDGSIFKPLFQDDGSAANRAGNLRCMVRAELIKFIAATAKEFAVRQEKDKAMHVKSVELTKSPNKGYYNGYWNRLQYDHDGQPAFMKGTAGGDCFLFYRMVDEEWIISDTVMIDPPPNLGQAGAYQPTWYSTGSKTTLEEAWGGKYQYRQGRMGSIGEQWKPKANATTGAAGAAGGAAGVGAEGQVVDREEELLRDMVRWDQGSHDCLVFDNANQTANFMSLWPGIPPPTSPPALLPSCPPALLPSCPPALARFANLQFLLLLRNPSSAPALPPLLLYSCSRRRCLHSLASRDPYLSHRHAILVVTHTPVFLTSLPLACYTCLYSPTVGSHASHRPRYHVRLGGSHRGAKPSEPHGHA